MQVVETIGKTKYSPRAPRTVPEPFAGRRVCSEYYYYYYCYYLQVLLLLLLLLLLVLLLILLLLMSTITVIMIIIPEPFAKRRVCEESGDSECFSRAGLPRGCNHVRHTHTHIHVHTRTHTCTPPSRPRSSPRSSSSGG